MSLQDLVIVTGVSGSGKGTVLKAFEDMGFFCIDNLPVQFIPKFIEGIHVSGGEIERVALVIDVRAGEHLRGFQKTIAELRENDFRVFVLFLEARDEVLVRRFSETRRPHPLTAETPIRGAIHQERKRLSSIRDVADVIIDTSAYSIHQVKALVTTQFRAQPRSSALSLNLVSFGYKHGIPLEADLVFDVRFLPNPYFVSGLRAFSGRDRRIARYMRKFPETTRLIRRLSAFLKYVVPLYVREGKSYLTVAIGCTGGRHRSVFVAEELARQMKIEKTTVRVRHRDEGR